MRRLPILLLLLTLLPIYLSRPPPVHADWLSDILFGLTGATPVPEEVRRYNERKLPPVGIFPVNQPSPTAQPQQLSTQSQGTVQAVSQTGDGGDPVRDAASQYTVACASKGCEPTPVPQDVGSFFINLIGNLLGIRDAGNDQATNFAGSNLPQGVAETALANLGANTSQIAIESGSGNVLSWPSTCVDPLVCGYDLAKCGALPPRACDQVIAAIPVPPTETPTPLPTPTSTITPTLSPAPTGGPPLAQCQITSDTANACHWRKFLSYLSNNEKEAKIASKICSLESGGGNPFALNDRCLASKYPDLSQRTRDYSVGLFQINLLAHQTDHCPGVLIDDWSTRDPADNTFMRSCRVAPGKEAALTACVNKLYDTDYNAQAMSKIYRDRLVYSGWDARWNAWSTYTQIVSNCTDLTEGNPSGGDADPLPANCPDLSGSISVPSTQYMKLDQSLGCMRPTLIVIHWSAAWTTAEATMNTLNRWKIDRITGNRYRNGCQFATDESHQLQLQDFWPDKVIWGYCVGGSDNAISINDEITGSYFERLIDSNYQIIVQDPSNPRDYGNRLKAESDRSVATTCWAMRQYNIPITRVIGHLESSWGQTSGKPDPSLKYMEYYKRRLSREC